MSYLGRTELKSSDIQLKASVTISGSSTNTVVLAWTAPNEQSIILKVNGVVQHTDAYSIAGSPTTITLASGNFADAAVVEVVGINDIGKAIVPADSSVTVAKLATTGTPDGSKFLQDDMAWTTVDSLPSQTSQSGKFLTTNGSAASWASAAAGFAGIHTDVSSGSETYTVPSVAAGDPADITKLLVFITGGGGGGGNGTVGVTYGSGGVAAGTVIASVTVVPGDTITVAIGAGGTAATVGGNSTFTHASGSGSFDTITAPGGPAGVTGSAVPGAPATPTIGASNDGIAIKGGYPGVAGNGSDGADSFWGGGGTGYNSLPNLAATVGEAFGSGGGGASYPVGYITGGAGAVGVCLIMEFK